jgi:hypothetical protein
LPAAVILAVVVNGFMAFRAVPGDFVLEKLHRIPAIFAYHIKNRIGLPFLGIVSSALPQGDHPLLNNLFFKGTIIVIFLFCKNFPPQQLSCRSSFEMRPPLPLN